MGNEKKDDKWERSDGYRKQFLKDNKGILGCIYFCVYCGKPITRATMQVDHVIAVKRVSKNPLYKIVLGINNTVRNVFKRIGCLCTGEKFVKYSGVNVDYNLVPACVDCNQLKKDKGGTWVARGVMGGSVWKVINAINNVCISLIQWLPFQIAMICLFGAAALATFVTDYTFFGFLGMVFSSAGAAIVNIFRLFAGSPV